MGGTWTSTTYERHDGTLHLSCAETAKLVRKALKLAFPGTKFSVRSSSYSMGASISVSWTDGPTQSAVNKVIGVYAGANFDGMIDLKTYNDHWLNPDGTVALAKAGGQGSTHPEYLGDPPSPNARLVSFGADFVHGYRRTSDEHREVAKRQIAEFLGKPSYEACVENGRLPLSVFVDEDGSVSLSHDRHCGDWHDSIVNRIVHMTDYS